MTLSPETISTTEQLTTRRELELLRDLQRLANERAREEERIRTALAEGLAKAEQIRDSATAEIERVFREEHGRAVAAAKGLAIWSKACGTAWNRNCRASRKPPAAKSSKQAGKLSRCLMRSRAGRANGS